MKKLLGMKKSLQVKELLDMKKLLCGRVTGCKSLSKVDGGCHNSLVVGMLIPAPVQQLGRGERADPGVSQLTLPNSDSIA